MLHYLRNTITAIQVTHKTIIKSSAINKLSIANINSLNMSTNTAKKGLLERLAEGPVIGDGGFTFGLEKRGYTQAGHYTPQCVVEFLEAVKQYHREFLRSGSDVMQAFTYNSSDSKLEYTQQKTGLDLAESGEAINTKACQIAREVANEGDALVSGCVNYTIAYKQKKGKEDVQAQFRKQMQCFANAGVDFIICEYFGFIEEIEWAIAVAKEFNKPVAAMMCIGSQYDRSGVPTGECAIRMAKAGADIVGVNCNFGIYNSLNTVKVMTEALEKANLHPYLMIQPLIFHTPETDTGRGYVELPEFILALEPRTATRFEVAKWARECYEAGIRYIGGCCGFEPYHIRAISEELSKERGKNCVVSDKYGFVLEGLRNMDIFDKKNGDEYWKNINPSTGRPKSAAFSEIKKH